MADPIRLQRFLARAGIASRRAAEELIVSGRVSVNGRRETLLGTKVDPDKDYVLVDGVPVEARKAETTIMLHKPTAYLTTMDDPRGRPTVADLIPLKDYPALFPVGRLDADTTGLLLFTTDGELGNHLIHPRHHVDKRYLVLVEGTPSAADMKRLRSGVVLDDGPTQPADVTLLRGNAARRAANAIGADEIAYALHGSKPDQGIASHSEFRGSFLSLTLREGRKRQIRRMMEVVGHPVIALHRESLGPIELGDLPRGQWRPLTTEESELLKKSPRRYEGVS